jgi:parvulin-like peptidyl-prolyl isomerase
VVGTTPLFTENTPVVIPKATRQLARIAFKLTDESPISNPLVGEGVVDIIAIKERQPSRIPSFAEVQARVTADFRRTEARKLAEAAGKKLAAELKQAVAQGAEFTQAAIQKGYSPLSLPKFSAATRNLPDWPPQVPLNQVKQVVRDLKVGEVSDYQVTRDGGFVLYLRKREPVGEQELKDALPTALADLQRSERFPAFRDWLSHQMLLSHLQFPEDTTRKPADGAKPAKP